jgi:zinc protease
MYESDPWDALEQEVASRLYGEHPYGRPVLGTRAELLATEREHLGAFHRDFYRPDGAVLVVAGAVSDADLEAIAATLGALPPGVRPRPALPGAAALAGEARIERRHGEVPRLLVALPAPPADHPDHPALRVLATALADGRTSRLRHDLVEERELCLFADADVSAVAGPGVFTVQAELHEGVAPAEVESRVRGHLRAVIEAPLPDAELARARAALLADWVFGNEQAHQQALSLGFGLTLFDDERQAERSLEAALAASAGELQEVAARWLDPERNFGVVGWALPKGKRKRG